MDDILASIRNAITEDIEAKRPAGQMPGDLRGAMREIRSRLGEEVAARPPQTPSVADWRSRNLPPREAPRPHVEDRPPPPPRTTPGFAGILGGEARNPRPSPAEYVPLRGSYAAEEPVIEQPRPSYQEPRYQEQQDYAPTGYLPPPGYNAADYGMMSPDAGSAAASAFQRLADSLMARATGDRGIEDMTRELLRSMLKQWLDDNLPALVERLVREEIERVARRGR
jgi:hypothetical protein